MYNRSQVLTLEDIKKIPAATVWGLIDEAYNALTNPFRDAGVLASDPLMASRVTGEGVRTDVQSWTGLEYEESNVSNDDPTDHATPLKMGTKIWTAVRNHRNVGVSGMNLVADFMAMDPMAALTDRVAAYKNQDDVAHVFAILNALVAGDKANGSKITHSQSDKKLDLVQVLTGLQKLGDASAAITTIGMSSGAYLQLQIQQINGFIPSAATNTAFGTFAGRTIIVDDRFKDVTVGGKQLVRLYGMGPGLFHVASAPAARKPVAVESDESAGNGSGQDTVWFRWKNIVHPKGYSYEGTPASVGGPTFAELATPTAFARKTEQQKIPLVVIEAPLADAPAA